MKRIRVVAALLARADDPSRYVVQQRLPKGDRSNLWEFPGGKVEVGETDEAALIRECREELGIEVTVHSQVWSTHHVYSDLEVELFIYSSAIVDGSPKPYGAQAVRFCTPVEMLALPFCEADIPFLTALVEGTVARSS